MKPQNKILLISGFVVALDWYLGFDVRFTIINVAWMILIVGDWIKTPKK